jgi:hypothetical protein
MSTNVHPARPEDADSIAELGDEFATYLRTLGDPSPTALDLHPLLQDGFGPNPAFSGIVAELDGKVHGYLLYHPGHDIDRGGRVLYTEKTHTGREGAAIFCGKVAPTQTSKLGGTPGENRCPSPGRASNRGSFL